MNTAIMRNRSLLKIKSFIIAIIMAFVPGYLNAAVVNYHPRIWLTPEYAETLRQRAALPTQQWGDFLNGYHGLNKLKEDYENNKTLWGGSLIPLALAFQATHNSSYADAGIEYMLKTLEGNLLPNTSFDTMSGLADALISVSIGYDWLYEQLSSKQKAFIIREVNQYMDALMKDGLETPWHAHSFRNLAAIGLWGYATFGDNERAEEFIEHSRLKRFDKLLGGLNELFGVGGGLPGGSFYGSGINILRYAEAVYTATGEDLYLSSPWFKDRMKFWLLFDYPGIFYDSNPIGYSDNCYDGTYGSADGSPYVGYLIYEDGDRDRSRTVDYFRTEKLILVHHFFKDVLARQLQRQLAQSPVNKMNNPEAYINWAEFLWFNPEQPAEEPEPLAHYAPGAGIVLMRSDWSDEATWIFFKCGDIFSTAHQHWDQNSFSIFKQGDLAIKSGIYDGDGVADHIVNYFSRTISANSILVYDPKEVLVSWRGVHYPHLLNDGGQKAYRFKPEFSDVNDWRRGSNLNDSGDIKGYEHCADYTYVRGDATNAYNNPRYCTPSVPWKNVLFHNSPKITLFSREFVFLRPDYIVIFDRVNSTNASFKKKWLLHFLNKPAITGYTRIEKGDALNGGTVYAGADEAIAQAGEGKLYVKTLLPDGHQIRLVGGKGQQDYWVFGRNVVPYEGMSRWEKGYGEWRIEVEPTKAQKEDVFLNVLYPCDKGQEKFPESVVVTSAEGNMTGAYIQGGEGLSCWVVMFGNGKDEMDKVSYKMERASSSKHLLCNMKPDTDYEILQNGQLLKVQKTSPQGLLYFETVPSEKDSFLIRTASRREK